MHPSLFISLLQLIVPSAKGQSCRCLYGQECWPSPAQFQQLASQVSQPLINPVPPESACYPVDSPSGNCSDVLENTSDGRWRSDQSGSMQTVNWETFTFNNGTISACYLNTSLGSPCEQGSVPIVGVDARFVSDIQSAVKFASRHNLRLVVKNTGHDYLGRSTARDSFLIWTHRMKNVSYHPTFVPDGAPKSKKFTDAITLGAGVQWYEAYDAVQAHNRTIVGGLSARASVGAAGGWIAGGGHSALTPSYGLGVDNALQFTMVTANGDHLTANEFQNADLFWALRGGGGGTYGVVTSVTYHTHPEGPIIGAFLTGVNFTSPGVAQEVITEWIRIQPSLAEQSWGGYSFFDNTNLTFFYISPKTTWEAANSTFNPFFDFVRNATNAGSDFQAVTLPFPSYYAFYQAFFSDGAQVGGNTYLGSRLIPEALVTSNPSEVAKTMLSLGAGLTQWYLVVGGAASHVDPSSAGINPAWRKAIAHVVVTEGWLEGAPDSLINAAKDRLTANVNKLEALAPGSGAYFNEASPFESDPQHTFFGPHYRRLRAIKKTYDPNSLFLVANGVGSEDWDTSLNCHR